MFYLLIKHNKNILLYYYIFKLIKKNIYYIFTAAILILLSISSFFIGYIYGENSAGAGTLYHDFENVWINLQICKHTSLIRR